MNSLLRMPHSSQLFDSGASAIRALQQREAGVFSERLDADVYVCPLCCGVYGRDHIDKLSREHAPPRSQGGPVIALTCRECNQAASGIQAEAARRNDANQFWQGAEGAWRVQIQLDGESTVRGEIHRFHGKQRFVVPRAINNPTSLDRLQTFRPGDGYQMNMQFAERWDPQADMVSCLRDAYLGVFALLGYSVTLTADLEPVRRQILDPDGCHYTGFRRHNGLKSQRGIMVLQEPVPCAAAVFGDDVVFIPTPSRFANLVEWLDHWDGATDELVGQFHRWPIGMPMYRDRG